MRHIIAQFFQLKGWLVYAAEYHRNTLEIKVRSAKNSDRCPHCFKSSKRVHQIHRRRLLHCVMDKVCVVLLITKRRFWCRTCAKPFTEALPGVKKFARRSDHLKKLLLFELRRSSFKTAGRQFATGAETARRIMLKAPVQEAVRCPSRGELRIGIDGKGRPHGEFPLTVVELKTKRLLAVLPNDRKQTTKEFFLSIPKENRQRISEVCMDLDRGLWAATREALPHANIVADHFHIIKLANEVIDNVRRIIQDPRAPIPRKIWIKGKEKLRPKDFDALVEYGNRYPKLLRLWILKEDLRRVYDQRNKKVAAFRLRKVIDGYASNDSGYAKDFSRTLERWRIEILNFFDNRTTNAAVEGRHQKMDLVERTSFGFKNMASYIIKTMLACTPFYLILHHTI